MLSRLVLMLLVIFSGVFGCAVSRGARHPFAQDMSDSDRLWEASQEALRRHSFKLDRVDRSNGVITTLPETSQSIAEFWRRDVHTPRDLAESTLNPIRRWAEVMFMATDDGTLSEFEVVVHKERLSSLDRQFNSTGAAYAFFGDSLPSTTGLVRVTPEQDRWVDLGRDHATENFLRHRIASLAEFNPRSRPPAEPVSR
jgi:hypothetical protein